VTALRLGEYQQGHQLLEYFDGKVIRHCCLGVACRVAMNNGVHVDVEVSGAKTSFDGEVGYLPSSVRSWLGVSHNPMISNMILGIEPGTFATAANDARGWDFNQIADAIEDYYELNEDDNG